MGPLVTHLSLVWALTGLTQREAGSVSASLLSPSLQHHTTLGPDPAHILVIVLGTHSLHSQHEGRWGRTEQAPGHTPVLTWEYFSHVNGSIDISSCPDFSMPLLTSIGTNSKVPS